MEHTAQTLSIDPGGFLNRWFVSPVEEEPYLSPPGTLEGEADNQWLRKGFGIHTYPCRTHFLTHDAPSINDRTIEEAHALLDRRRELYIPFGSRRVELSGFWHVPTRLACAAETTVSVPGDDHYRFRVRTSGGLRLWIDGTAVTTTGVYHRNAPVSQDFEIELSRGSHRFVVWFDDLAERDTLFGFSLELTKGQLLIDPVPVAEERPAGFPEPDEFAAIETALGNACLSATPYRSEPVTLVFQDPLPWDVDVRLEAQTEFVDGHERRTADTRFEAGSREYRLFDLDDLPIGFSYIRVTIGLEGLWMRRVFNAEIAPVNRLVSGGRVNLGARTGPRGAVPLRAQTGPGDTVDQDGPRAPTVRSSLATRKEQALSLCAREGGSIPQTALAGAWLGQSTAGHQGEPIREILNRHLDQIRDRYDCSDFYLTGLFWFLVDSRLPASLDEPLRSRLKDVVLNYRYWIDEPGSDVMWFFSENHALLFHTCELLAGQLFPDEQFSNAGITGCEHRKRAEKRLNQWFERFFHHGLGEWYSPAYIPIDVLGLVTLYQWARDDRVQRLAREALDRLFTDMSRHSMQGVLATTHGRAYDKELFGRITQPTNALAWTAWGVGWCPPVPLSLVPLALSSYEPPDALPAQGHRMEWGGPEASVRIERFQGKQYALSAAVNYRPGQPGYQEHLVNLSTDTGVHVWVNHPGEDDPTGIGRPGYWSGNGVLPDVVVLSDVAFARFCLTGETDLVSASNRVPFTHAFFPTFAFDRWTNQGSWWLGWTRDVGIALWAGPIGGTLVTSGATAHREVRQEGLDTCWILTATERYGEFEAFANAYGSTTVSATDGVIEWWDPQGEKLSVALRCGS